MYNTTICCGKSCLKALNTAFYGIFEIKKNIYSHYTAPADKLYQNISKKGIIITFNYDIEQKVGMHRITMNIFNGITVDSLKNEIIR